jgi:TonB family protein
MNPMNAAITATEMRYNNSLHLEGEIFLGEIFGIMNRKTLRRIPGAIFLLLLSTLASALADDNANSFAYVSKNYVITAEVAAEHSFVLNFINLSDFVIVIQPNEFIYKGASGRFYIGQVFESEHKDTRGETQKYSASFLLKGHTFAGLTVVGAFHEQDRIEELSVRIGAKRFYLQPLEKAAFEQLAAKIGDLDLQNPNTSAALEQANISEIGTVRSTAGTSEWDRDWQGLILPDGVNPPKIIEQPEIDPTSDARRSRTYGRVKLSGLINKNGGIQELRVVKGLGHGLDQRALEGVKNSWLFLPATKNGEVVDTVITFEVDFPAPEKNK